MSGAVSDAFSPWVTAAFNNTAGNKLDSFLSSTLIYSASGSCDQETVTGSLVATLKQHRVPPGLPPVIAGRTDQPDAPYGSSSMDVKLYGPLGAVIQGLKVDGAEVPTSEGSGRNRPVWGTGVQLMPGESVSVAVDFTQPAYKGQPLTVVAQSMVQPTDVWTIDDRSCG